MKYLIFLLVVFFSPWTFQLFHLQIRLDQTIWQAKDEEIFLLNERRSYYPNQLGWIFQNKLTLAFYKLEQNFFQNLDPNLYFFATHPRERRGYSEFERFPAIFLPFFLLGLLFINKKRKIIFCFFLALLINSFLDTRDIGPFLAYPFIVYICSIGIFKTIIWLKH